MSYPFDQLLGLATANQTLALRLVEIAQAAGQRQSKIVARAVFAASDQTVKDQPSPLSFPVMPDYAKALVEAEECRQALTSDARAAVEAWRANVGGLFSPEDAWRQVAGACQAWSNAFPTAAGGEMKAEGGKAERAQPVAATSTKARATA